MSSSKSPQPSERSPVQVLLAEDSPLWADVLRRAIESGGDLEVIAAVTDGAAAVAQVERLRPNVVLLDIHLPVLDGLGAIKQIMAQCPTPILATTSDPSRTLIFDALQRGALELFPKPERHPPDDEFVSKLQQRLRILASVPVIRHLSPRAPSARLTHRATSSVPDSPARVIGIVASTGGPISLTKLLAGMRGNFPPIVVVQHLAPGFVNTFARWLDRQIEPNVTVASPGALLAQGQVYLAGDGRHVKVSSSGRISLTGREPIGGHCPSGDALLESLASEFGRGAVGVVLTGMGSDGARGLARIHQAGGRTFAQDQASSVVYGMPRAAAESGAAQSILPLDELAARLNLFSAKPTFPRAGQR